MNVSLVGLKEQIIKKMKSLYLISIISKEFGDKSLPEFRCL